MAKNPESPQPSSMQNSYGPFLVALIFVVYYFFTLGSVNQAEKISYSELVGKIQKQEVQSVTIQGLDVRGVYVGAGLSSVKGGGTPDFAAVLPNFAGRKLREGIGGGAGVFSFGKSKARLYKVSEGGPRYSDVAGLQNAKQDLMEIVDYLKNPQPYRDMGAKMPRGILMMGAPGTGKTLLARATASEAGVPFFSVSGSEFIEMYVGVGASRVRDMFKQAREQSPALIFIDEIDSVGRVRGTGVGGGNDEREQTLNQVLAEMDGFDSEEAIVILGATNRPDVLDPALLRPERFDRKIVLEMPQRNARVEILKVHTRDIALHKNVELDGIAALTVGFSGADLANLINEAVLKAVREKRTQVTTIDLHEARDKVIMGAARTDFLNSGERNRIACHEAGHAITAYFSSKYGCRR